MVRPSAVRTAPALGRAAGAAEFGSGTTAEPPGTHQLRRRPALEPTILSGGGTPGVSHPGTGVATRPRRCLDRWLDGPRRSLQPADLIGHSYRVWAQNASNLTAPTRQRTPQRRVRHEWFNCHPGVWAAALCPVREARVGRTSAYLGTGSRGIAAQLTTQCAVGATTRRRGQLSLSRSFILYRTRPTDGHCISSSWRPVLSP